MQTSGLVDLTVALHSVERAQALFSKSYEVLQNLFEEDHVLPQILQYLLFLRRVLRRSPIL